ncbi:MULTISPECIES: short chain dehydrogenase [unclassified Paraburkholderia]|uniref:short chain dehydrogenase n=1 Tax=unclassified Paraburkholderia TaxID=2615204 RepID=UPI002AB1E773|nr:MULTISPECIES: short chain dehydrogenase [unclassified Paraburkholderia]
MKIIVVGASGAVGRAVVETLGAGHTVVTVGRNSGDFRADITRDDSVEALFREVGKVDAIVSAAGHLHFGPFAQMSTAQFNIGLQDKLLGQVRLALIGQHYLNDGGSITLTSGIVGEEPIAQGVNATTVNAALEGFVRAAATELRRDRRINVVSPTVLTESLPSYGPFFPGFESVSAKRAALAYQRSVEGVQTGRVFKVY